jgi:enamine deaminase RidA (YjgF/YER057c/UK114 family)
MVQAEAGLGFCEALADLEARYRTALDECGLAAESAVFARVYLGDAENQKQALATSRLWSAVCAGAVSVIQQRALDGAPCAMLSYHLVPSDGGLVRRTHHGEAEHGAYSCLVEGRSYRALRVAALQMPGGPDSETQTSRICTALRQTLRQHRMQVAANLLRTWIYVRDIDTHYQGMVVARRRFYEQEGLSMGCRYPASTGIEGGGAEQGALVTFDALALSGLDPAQIVRMEALANLPPTIRYGVTFERGLRIRYGDRSHVYLSGTASIGPDGAVMHLSNPRNQAERAFVNARALLEPQGVGLGDMRYLLVYLRNPADWPQVEPVVRAQVPSHVPVLALQASVCRPGWLVEIEGEAVVDDDTAYPVFA